jgi:hypothetical protein
VLAIGIAAISAWVLIATWTVKLFPMYSGGGTAPMRMRDVWNWYLSNRAAHATDLSLLALGSAPWLYAGLLVSFALSILLSAIVIRDLIQPRFAEPVSPS